MRIVFGKWDTGTVSVQCGCVHGLQRHRRFIIRSPFSINIAFLSIPLTCEISRLGETLVAVWTPEWTRGEIREEEEMADQLHNPLSPLLDHSLCTPTNCIVFQTPPIYSPLFPDQLTCMAFPRNAFAGESSTYSASHTSFRTTDRDSASSPSNCPDCPRPPPQRTCCP